MSAESKKKKIGFRLIKRADPRKYKIRQSYSIVVMFSYVFQISFVV